ncbi:MAG: hypothetical protein NMNS01_18330 [Nitrosomonas sp.]|nr:MAG: hypothetical protein NMNS01_18330 [Nitrosomonas sp.]
MGPPERARILRKIGVLIEENRDNLAALEHLMSASPFNSHEPLIFVLSPTCFISTQALRITT